MTGPFHHEGEAMLRVGLTGGIATGKSYVARRLRAAGIPVVDADVLARAAVAPGTPGHAAIVDRFGPGILAEDGSLDRPAMARLIFQDRDARRALESIVHPSVRAGIEAFFEALPPSTPVAVADIPLLYETGRRADFDVVVVAACPAPMQVERVVARDPVTRDQAEARVAAQFPIDEKVRGADYVIDTSGAYADTDAAVARLVETLQARAAGR